MQQWAEAEIVLPSGPRRSLRFRASFQPWTGLIFEEFARGPWRRFFGTGNVQSGKTTLFQVIPTGYSLFELREDVIIGAPDIDLAQSVWEERLLPALELTAYKDLLPRKGAGSRGGKSKSLLLGNGTRVRFMGAGGGDAQRSSHTARVILLTEIDKMDEAGAVSRETDPVTQMEKRAAAFGDRAQIFAECTVSIESGRVWQEIQEIGSGSRIFVRCPHCQRWIYPERKHFGGWDDAETVSDAREKCHYACQECGVLWTEADRELSLTVPRLVHKGQSVAADGQVVGPVPRTNTLGVRWNAMHSGLLAMGDIAEDEWRAQRTGREEAERSLCQFTWTVPYYETERTPELSYRFLAEHVADYAFDVLAAGAELPAGVAFTTAAIDVHKTRLYWLIDGWSTDLTRWSLCWGVEEIVPEESHRDPTAAEVTAALDRIKDQHTDRYSCVAVWVDTGYKHEASKRNIVRQWCRTAGPRVHALVGRSKGSLTALKGTKMLPMPGQLPDSIQASQQADGSLLWFLDVDSLKDDVHARFWRDRAAAGYHFFPRETANEKKTDRARGPNNQGWIFRHFMLSKRVVEVDRNGKQTRLWKEARTIHLWDCAVYSYAGALVEQSRQSSGQQPTPYTVRSQERQPVSSDTRDTRDGWKIGR
jgi:phage terminase large subunit GpA-like protein